ncbi:MAG TPA: DUF456 domain-containing protein [Candidatus Absconditabacterales bacterium]|nr:DUF456 domain-containing protein [Candidatus Absconditabacterales bacterium]
MDIILIIVGLILLITGFIGDFLPIIPGPIMSYLALIFLQIAEPTFSTSFLIIMAIICAIITTVDYIVPILGTKKMRGTKRGIRGSTIGLIIGIIILPLLGITIGPFGLIGLLGGPFMGAYIGEILYHSYKKQKPNNKKALKAALGSFLGFLTGIFIKLIFSTIIAGYFFTNVYKFIIK